MSDLADIKNWWATLTDTSERPFLAVSAPDEDRAESSYVHEDATEEAAELGLDIETLSYAGWFRHSEELAFVDGAMRSPLYLQFSGDRERIREALSTVPEGFVVGGGETDHQAFWIKKPSKLDALDLASDEAAETAEGLIQGPWEDEPEERRWLHTFVQHAEADPVVRCSVLTRFGFQGELSEDDMRAWVRDGFPDESDVEEASDRAAQFVTLGGRDIVAPLVEQWMKEAPDEIQSWLLSLWDDEPTRQLLRERANRGIDLDYFFIREATERGLSEQEIAAEFGEEYPNLQDAAIKALTWPPNDEAVQSRAAAICEDPGLPDWLRNGVRGILEP